MHCISVWKSVGPATNWNIPWMRPLALLLTAVDNLDSQRRCCNSFRKNSMEGWWRARTIVQMTQDLGVVHVFYRCLPNFWLENVKIEDDLTYRELWAFWGIFAWLGVGESITNCGIPVELDPKIVGIDLTTVVFYRCFVHLFIWIFNRRLGHGFLIVVIVESEQWLVPWIYINFSVCM